LACLGMGATIGGGSQGISVKPLGEQGRRHQAIKPPQHFQESAAMKTILAEIEREIIPGTIIPKPQARADFIVKGWGSRRGGSAHSSILSRTTRLRPSPTRKASQFQSGSRRSSI